MKIQELTNHKRCFDGKDATRVHGILESEGPNLHVEIGYDDVNRGNEVTVHSPRAKLGLESEAVLQEEANIKRCFWIPPAPTTRGVGLCVVHQLVDTSRHNSSHRAVPSTKSPTFRRWVCITEPCNSMVCTTEYCHYN